MSRTSVPQHRRLDLLLPHDTGRRSACSSDGTGLSRCGGNRAPPRAAPRPLESPCWSCPHVHQTTGVRPLSRLHALGHQSRCISWCRCCTGLCLELPHLPLDAGEHGITGYEGENRGHGATDSWKHATAAPPPSRAVVVRPPQPSLICLWFLGTDKLDCVRRAHITYKTIY